MRSLRPARTWLDAREDGGLAPLLSELRRREPLDCALAAVLPHQLRPYCHVAALTAETLVVITTSPVWSATLHHLAPGLCAEVTRRLGQPVRRLQVRVDPGSAPPGDAERPPRVRRPGATCARDIEAAAAGMTDPRLGSALQRLARTLARAAARTEPDPP